MTDSFHVARLIPRERRKKATPSGPVEITRLHPDVLERLKNLPGYDPRKVKIIDETTAILKN